MADTRFGGGGKYDLEPLGRKCGDFPANRRHRDLGVALAPSYLCAGKETASVAYASSGAAG